MHQTFVFNTCCLSYIFLLGCPHIKNIFIFAISKYSTKNASNRECLMEMRGGTKMIQKYVSTFFRTAATRIKKIFTKITTTIT